jgi:acyl-CoA thioester hydrolase
VSDLAHPAADRADLAPAVSPRFCLDLVVSPDEIDELNHVSNLAYLRWVLRVAQAHSTAVGYDYRAYDELGAVFVVRRHEIDYRRPAYAGEEIALVTWIESWSAASSWRCTSIARVSDGDELAAARTQWAFVATAGGRPRRIPAALREAFARPLP